MKNSDPKTLETATLNPMTFDAKVSQFSPLGYRQSHCQFTPLIDRTSVTVSIICKVKIGKPGNE